MPIYEFSCQSCKTVFEVLMRKKDETITCPACSGKEVSKLFSSFSYSSSGETSRSSGANCSSCASHNCSTCN